MGTNYYARIIPNEDKKQELINAIGNDNFDKVLELSNELYGSKGEYEETGGQIHLGKKSYGWSLLWNPNVYYYCDGYLDENKHYVPVWKHKFTYPLTKQGITDFVMQENVYIIDVREESEFNEGHLIHAYNIPLGIINTIKDEIVDLDSKIIVYCRSGSRSKNAQEILSELGYSNVYDMGGIINWPYDL